MLLPRVIVSRVRFLYVLTFGVGLNRVVSSGAAEVPGTPVFRFRAPVVGYLLFEGVVLPDGFLSYFGERCVDHRSAADGEHALKPPQRHARDLSRFQVHGPQVVRYHGTGARCSGHGGKREAAVVGDGLGKDGVRGEVVDAEGRYDEGRLLRGGEAGKRPPEAAERAVDEQPGCASGALVPLSGDRQHEWQRPDEVRRDAGGEDIALSQSGAHEPETVRSEVAKAAVYQARGGPEVAPPKSPASTSPTRMPDRAASKATRLPSIPPPITSTLNTPIQTPPMRVPSARSRRRRLVDELADGAVVYEIHHRV